MQTSATDQSPQTTEELARDLRVSGLLTLLMAPGLALFGLILGILFAAKIAPVMFGIALLLAHIGAGLLVAALAVERWPSLKAAPTARS